MELGVLPALLGLAISVSPISPGRDQSSPVRGSLSGVFTFDDYPADALDLNQEGSVGVLLRVDAKGAVSDCVVTASSGSAALDAQTCRIAWLRAKFIPARDRSGAPVASTYRQRINWRISDDGGASSKPWLTRWIISGWEDGRPSCLFESAENSQSENAGPGQCPPYAAGIPSSLSESVKGHPDIVVELRLSVGDMPMRALAPGEQFIGRELARLDIDAAGKVVTCKVLETAGVVPPQLSRACLIVAKRYAPRNDASGLPTPFTAYFTTGLYARDPRSPRAH